jgi:hypothetical protein
VRAIAVLGIVAALAGAGCASTAAATKGEERYRASEQSAGLALSDEVIVEQLLGMMGGDRVEALLAGKPVKLSPTEAVLLAEIYATYGSKSAAREAMRAAQPASQRSIELVAVPTDSTNGERTARR